MAKKEHLKILKQGVAIWNMWRDDNPEIRPDLREANLSKANLSGADLSNAILSKANLSGANLADAYLHKAIFERADLTGVNAARASLDAADFIDADLSGADLTDSRKLLSPPRFSGAKMVGAKLNRAKLSGTRFTGANLSNVEAVDVNLSEAELFRAKLVKAKLDGTSLRLANMMGVNLTDSSLVKSKLIGANLSGAELTRANFSEANLDLASLNKANLKGANLRSATLTRLRMIGTNLEEANLMGCRIYGIAAWNVNLSGAKQSNLIITPGNESAVMVDDLEVAQFIYLLLDRQKIREVINTVTRRGVLILGRFGDGGLVLLQAIAAWLRRPENGGYLPLLFDFPRPESKTYTETVRTLAGLARFVILDLSGPSVPQEITATVDLHEIPFVPIIEQNREDWSMFRDFLVKERVLEPIRFTDQDHLLEILAGEVIAPAEKLIEKRQKRLEKIFGRA